MLWLLVNTLCFHTSTVSWQVVNGKTGEVSHQGTLCLYISLIGFRHTVAITSVRTIRDLKTQLELTSRMHMAIYIVRTI